MSIFENSLPRVAPSIERTLEEDTLPGISEGEIVVIRSTRRKKNISAYRQGGRIVVSIPARMSKATIGGPWRHSPDQNQRHKDGGGATSIELRPRARETSTATIGPRCMLRRTSAGRFFITPPSTRTLSPSFTGGRIPGKESEARKDHLSWPRAWS